MNFLKHQIGSCEAMEGQKALRFP